MYLVCVSRKYGLHEAKNLNGGWGEIVFLFP
jgi:hypothetical protein